jgi:hypothetical protein
MNLDDIQKQTVTQWINEGVKLSEIQTRLSAQFGLRLTYMEVRLLVDDLKLIPKDPEPVKPSMPSSLDRTSPPANAASPTSSAGPLPDALLAEEPVAHAKTGITVTVDQVTRPGSVVSGSVKFSDGNSAQWYLDQYGRLGLAAQTKGYKPSAEDLQAFQAELQNELQKMGF